MAPPTLHEVPAQLTAGLSWRFTLAFHEFPASEGWTVRARFVGDSTALELTGTGSGTDWAFDGVPTETARLAAGPYRYTVWGELAGARYEMATGVVQVLPDPATVAPGASRTATERQLALVRSAIESLLAGQVKAWTIGTRSFTAHDLDELQRMEAALTARLSVQRAGRIGRPIHSTFRAPL